VLPQRESRRRPFELDDNVDAAGERVRTSDSLPVLARAFPLVLDLLLSATVRLLAVRAAAGAVDEGDRTHLRVRTGVRTPRTFAAHLAHLTRATMRFARNQER
jgi:hypothetical protein